MDEMDDMVMSEAWCRRARERAEREGTERTSMIVEGWRKIPGNSRSAEECLEAAILEYGPPRNAHEGAR